MAHCVIGLGYASMYNYAKKNNAIAKQDFRARVVQIQAIKDIKVGEEITIDYVCDPWFEVAE